MWLGFPLLVLFGLTRFVPHLGVIAWVFQLSNLTYIFRNIDNCKYKTKTIINNKASVCEGGHTQTSWHEPPSTYQNHPHCVKFDPSSHVWPLESVSTMTPPDWLHLDLGDLRPRHWNNDKLIPTEADESFVLRWQFNRASIMLIWYQRLESSLRL